MNRRQFVYVMSAAALAASGSVAAKGKEKARRPLSILVLGGTKFLGVHIVELALQRGHTVTLFNRGKTNADLFPQLEHLKGDRDAQLDSLKGRRWDAVIDDSGWRRTSSATCLYPPYPCMRVSRRPMPKTPPSASWRMKP
jgi:2'-hydroxyisoflavone reductase